MLDEELTAGTNGDAFEEDFLEDVNDVADEFAETAQKENAEADNAEVDDDRIDDEMTDGDDSDEQKAETPPEQEKTDIKSEDKPGKKELSERERSENARKRREAEFNAKLEKARMEERVKTVIEVTGGKNPYTNEPITDAHGVKTYEIMKKISDGGGDPVNDFAKEIEAEYRKSNSELESEKAKSEEFNDWAKNDALTFQKANPDVKLSELLKDEDFTEFSEDLIAARVPMEKVYAKWQKIQEKLQTKEQESKEKAKDAVAQTLANKNSSVGSAKSTAKGEEGMSFKTYKEWDAYGTDERLSIMSESEYERYKKAQPPR